MVLSEQHRMIRDALRSFAAERLAPNAARWDREHHFPREALRELAALGAFGVAVPEPTSAMLILGACGAMAMRRRCGRGASV